MSHELSLRQKAIRWKQAGRAVSWICQRLKHSREWFYKWWSRYQLEGASGLCDRSHAPQGNPRRWSGEIRQAILDIRDRGP
ncbi:MAG TPA: leucine zipper domain-containing protein [Anaerolineales bacterium]|nr:leucine zipper domain-containing protein [Anaerolineales bacterium]